MTVKIPKTIFPGKRQNQTNSWMFEQQIYNWFISPFLHQIPEWPLHTRTTPGVKHSRLGHPYYVRCASPSSWEPHCCCLHRENVQKVSSHHLRRHEWLPSWRPLDFRHRWEKVFIVFSHVTETEAWKANIHRTATQACQFSICFNQQAFRSPLNRRKTKTQQSVSFRGVTIP